VRICPSCSQKKVNDNGRCFNTTCSEYSVRVLDYLCKEVECEECGGTGQLMTMVCYGGDPIENIELCDDCEGEGILLIN